MGEIIETNLLQGNECFGGCCGMASMERVRDSELNACWENEQTRMRRRETRGFISRKPNVHSGFVFRWMREFLITAICRMVKG